MSRHNYFTALDGASCTNFQQYKSTNVHGSLEQRKKQLTVRQLYCRSTVQVRDRTNAANSTD
eukprot:133028-Pleurochrysis_carterae.AAC.1